MMRATRTIGITVIELLLVLAIGGIILATLTAFFQAQTRASSTLRARNEVEGTLRSVGEVMMQDLQLAGSRAVYDGTSVVYLDLRISPEPEDTTSAEWAEWKATQCSGGHRDGCVVLNEGGADLVIYYATSLDRGGGSACRRIEYFLDEDDGMLYRKDVACDDTTTGFDGFSFAAGVLDIRLSFICHDPDNVVSDISTCYSQTTYPRQATITITGESENPNIPAWATVTLATSLPNLRPPVDYVDL